MNTPYRYDAEEFRILARERLHPAPAEEVGRSDDDLNRHAPGRVLENQNPVQSGQVLTQPFI